MRPCFFTDQLPRSFRHIIRPLVAGLAFIRISDTSFLNSVRTVTGSAASCFDANLLISESCLFTFRVDSDFQRTRNPSDALEDSASDVAQQIYGRRMLGDLNFRVFEGLNRKVFDTLGSVCELP